MFCDVFTNAMIIGPRYSRISALLSQNNEVRLYIVNIMLYINESESGLCSSLSFLVCRITATED